MFVLYVTQLCQNEGTETPRPICILKTFVDTLNIFKILILDLTLTLPPCEKALARYVPQGEDVGMSPFQLWGLR